VENSFLTLKVKQLFWITNSVLTNNNKFLNLTNNIEILEDAISYNYSASSFTAVSVPPRFLKKCGKVNKNIHHDILICYGLVNLDKVILYSRRTFPIKSSQINKIEVLLPQLTCYFLKLITIKKVVTGPTNLRQMVDTTPKKERD